MAKKTDRVLTYRERKIVARTLWRLRRLLRHGAEHSAYRTLDWHFSEINTEDEETPLEFLGLSAKSCEALYDFGVSSVEDLCNRDGHSVMAIPKIGPHLFDEIQRCLKRCALSLRNVV